VRRLKLIPLVCLFWSQSVRCRRLRWVSVGKFARKHSTLLRGKECTIPYCITLRSRTDAAGPLFRGAVPGLPHDSIVIFDRHLAKAQHADRRRRADRGLQFSQQPLLTDEKPLAMEGETDWIADFGKAAPARRCDPAAAEYGFRPRGTAAGDIPSVRAVFVRPAGARGILRAVHLITQSVWVAVVKTRQILVFREAHYLQE